MIRGEVFRALADDSRREMVEMLSYGPKTASELGDPFDMSAPAVSQHLKVLLEAGLVTVRKDGRFRVYDLATAEVAATASWLGELEQRWHARLERLERVVARLAAEQKRKGGGDAP